VAEPVEAPVERIEPHTPELQEQIDDLRAALQEWRRTREYSQPTAERLAQITLQCARLVESWERTDQGQDGPALNPASTANRALAGQVPDDAAHRIRAIERTIEHEWDALRSPEGTDLQLREQTMSLAESCVAAANLTVRGFARTESRLAALEQDIQGRMDQLSRDLQSVVTELRTARPHAPGAAAAFPLESVMRIHEELRESDGSQGAGAAALTAGGTRALPQSTESALALAARVESLEKVVANPAGAQVQPRTGRVSRVAIGGLIAALAGIAFFTLWIQRRVDTRLNEAAARVAAAERQRDETTEQTNTRLAATREEAAREVAAARQTAAQAQIVGNVLAAPDLVRYWLTGADPASRAYAQVLFSRSRGMVFSASRLPPPEDGKAYQLWLLTRGAPISAGVLTPDSAGRVTLATDVPISAERRLVGALVTIEDGAGAAQPSATRMLVMVE
jgi:hypothetical protein